MSKSYEYSKKNCLECLGEYIHTALRKACDSTWTSVAWNIVQILDAKDWRHYIGGLDKCLRSTPREKWVESIKNYSKQWEHIRCDAGSYAKMILKICFENFDDDDWYGYCCYLVEEK